MTTFSFSQVSTYLQCPRKYQYRYLDKLTTKAFETTYELLLGSLVHQALERLYTPFQKGQQVPTPLFPPVFPTKTDLLSYFNHHREKEIKRLTGTFRENPFYTSEQVRQRGENYLISYYDHHKEFQQIYSEEKRGVSQKENVSKLLYVETEKEILFTLPNGQSFKGIIDRLDYLTDGSLVISDYKTGKKLPTIKDNPYKQQLSLYAYALRQQFGPEISIKARLSYLHFGIEDEWEIQSDFLNALVATYQSSISQLQADRATYYQTKTPLPTSESVLCSYCEYQSSCPLFQRNFKTKTDFSSLEQEIVALVDTYADISKQMNEHKKQCEQNKKLIVDYLQAKNLCEYIIDDTTLKLSYRKGIKIPDVEKVVQWLCEKGLREQGSSITRFTLASLVQKGDVSVKELGKSAENNPYELLLVAKKKT